MREDDFAQQYAGMTDDQLMQVMADKKELLPEAISALDLEVQRRQLSSSAPPQKTWEVDPDDPVRSLEDVFRYRSLQRQKRILDRFGYWIIFGPVVLLLVSARYAYKDPENLKTIVGWVILVAGYWMFTVLRISAYSCPQCAQRFGNGANCFYCGFPRSSTPENSTGRAG